MKKIFQSLKTVNYKLWLAILVTFLMPTIYKTFRIFLLGSYPNSSGLDIASQLQWLDLFYEVIQEALILPLFFILGKYINDKKDFSNKVRGGLIITIIIYSCLSVFIIIFARPLVKLMAQRPELVDETVKYISLETVASLFSTLVKFLTIVLITIKKDKFIYITLGIQMILSVVLDIFLVSNLNVSFKTGVNGIPITNIIVNIVLIIVVSIILIKENINLSDYILSLNKDGIVLTNDKETLEFKFSFIEALAIQGKKKIILYSKETYLITLDELSSPYKYLLTYQYYQYKGELEDDLSSISKFGL